MIFQTNPHPKNSANSSASTKLNCSSLDMYSWLRQSLSRTPTSKKEDTHKLKSSNYHKGVNKIEDEEYYGVTDQLIQFIKTLTLDTFKNFSLPEEQSDGVQTTVGGIRVDLSEWQQQHATLILSKVKELSQLRYKICPRFLKERQFWRIYFSLVKGYVTEYELRAIQLDKLRRMATDNEEPTDSNGIELEMTEAKQTCKLSSP